MSRSAPLLMLPPRPNAVDEKEASHLSPPNLDDHHLAARVERALRATGHGSLSAVCVTVHARVVVLGGRVRSYYLKQIAQETALTIPGVRRVRNDLNVCPMS